MRKSPSPTRPAAATVVVRPRPPAEPSPRAGCCSACRPDAVPVTSDNLLGSPVMIIGSLVSRPDAAGTLI